MENRELKLALEYVASTGCHVFLTGKAGTGKTTFLHDLKKNSPKQMIITAPTGVAAINAGGVTLHSFFQLPFGPFIPGSEAYENSRKRLFRFSREKKRIIQSLDLLVIDEISMVRADLLDSVDAVLRYHRRSDKPFGGVQLLMIGDLHQLSPVAKPDEWQLLQQHYESVYFFSSHALGSAELLTIELQHIYRQSDPEFIRILNQVRDNRLDPGAIDRLNQRYAGDALPDNGEGYITLTTHNNSSDTINATRLMALPGNESCFDAEVSGEFPHTTFPTPGRLALKQGAQVMLLRNDASGDKRYYNGKIGTISAISSQQVHISCPGETDDIVVEPVEWQNITYTVNPDTNDIQEEIIGRFRQFPLKLAWAITIHKSQGLTFDKAVIDAQAAFSHGQVYVALSRCRSLDGIVLRSPIPSRGIETDEAVLRFVDTARQTPPSEERLLAARQQYQQQLLVDCFDFQVLQSRLSYLVSLVRKNAGVVQVSGAGDLGRLQDDAREHIFQVGDRFRHQLMSAFTENPLPESSAYILERTAKASAWFREKLASVLRDPVESLRIETDNRELGRKLSSVQGNLRQDIQVKMAGVVACGNGFSSSAYLRAVADAGVDPGPGKEKKSQAVTYTESDIDHPELFQSLRDWRTRKAEEQGVPRFHVLHQRVLIEIAVRLPDTKKGLRQIKGVGDKLLEKYGDDLVAMVAAYRADHGIVTVDLPPVKENRPGSPSQTKKSSAGQPSGENTRQTTLDLFDQGLSPVGIAEHRGLSLTTIHGHLCVFIENGQLDIDRLLPPEKQQAIADAIAQAPDQTLKSVKHELGSNGSYDEIKMMMAYRNRLAAR